MAKNETNNNESSAAEETPVSGKGHATPKRREQEAANKRPLIPSDRKEAAKQSRAANAAARDRARVGLAAGDERYLPARDKGPQRRFARDYVDARFSIGELLIPVMFLIIITSFIQIGPNPYLVPNIANYTMWAFVCVLLIDLMILSGKLKTRLEKKFGQVDRGVRWYAMMRSLQLRPMRLPKPQVARREYPN